MVVAVMVETPVAMVAVVAAVATAVAVTSVAMVAVTEVTAVMVEAAVDAAHARTPATHKAAVSQPSHACSKLRLRVSAHRRLTKMHNRQAMSRRASHLLASLPAAIAVTTAAVAVAVVAALVVAAVADVRVVVKVAPATSARSTVVNHTR